MKAKIQFIFFITFYANIRHFLNIFPIENRKKYFLVKK